ncbi:MAG: hypothetical protein VZR98_03885 [Candidatus Enteromonas sp.]|jgi:biopolymer transport protein ExbB/TolQ|nr:hypothetical protein [Bacilli bacterium]MEE3299415.1 hypothetical protein [Candidatus Enteromonas sp.]MBQ2053070.1 hypothetical protein [Bacilli bacterium]MBQ4182732.1 hypothetical protein [Bacilli bacterium]MCR5092041.1 hypothetical protein [Bacilli bacterium]
MEIEELNEMQLDEIRPGEALTLATVMAVMVIAVLAVVAYRVFRSRQGNIKLPGGYGFEWK